MNTWQTIQQFLKCRHKLYLLTVIKSEGSAPGRRGFKMIIADNGTLYGSIGGGIMEYNLVEKAKSLLNSKIERSFIIEQVHHGKAESSSGMICSGSQVIAFTPLNEKHNKLIEQCDNSQKILKISHEGITLLKANEVIVTEILSKNDWLYTELLTVKLVFHIFGAGHVSFPTSELLDKLGYKVYLYDNRDNINTFSENNHVFSKEIINYNNIFASVKIAQNDWVLLMTHKFTEDKLLLSQLLKLGVQYLGVLGSKNKIKVMFNALLNDGFKQRDLDKVYAPIGLAINSRTIEEIAISIVAEIISIRNK